jgi:hypothetical protein
MEICVYTEIIAETKSTNPLYTSSTPCPPRKKNQTNHSCYKNSIIK